ncbi:MAG: hypothetical protein PVH17_06605 [Anaerolineae bacterium]
MKCGQPVEERFRLVMGRGRMERLCPVCAGQLSALVQAVGETAQLSLADERFVAWLETGRWTTREGRTLQLEDLPTGWHSPECPCCALFAEE